MTDTTTKTIYRVNRRIISAVVMVAMIFTMIISNTFEVEAKDNLRQVKVLHNPEDSTGWFSKDQMYDKTLDDRIILLSMNYFDPVTYAWYNPDLLESGITTDKALFDHWVHTGIYEGRRSSLIFSVDHFIENNPSLTYDYVTSHMDQAFQFCSELSGLYTAQELKTIFCYNPASTNVKYQYMMFAILKNSYGFETVAQMNNYYKTGEGNVKGYTCAKANMKTPDDFPSRKSSNKRWIAINNYYHQREIDNSNYQWGMMKEGLLNWEEVYIEHVVPLNPTVQLTTSVAATSRHDYYGKNLTAAQKQQADAYCYSIAKYVLTSPECANMTNLQKIDYAAKIVATRCTQLKYGKDANKYYKSPYGVAAGGIYTCAGSTRTMGRVLEYMGIQWAHVNENENCHQWCVFYLDGVLCCADGMGGFATYGNGVSYATTLDGQTIWPSTWRVVYSFKK